MFPLIIDLAHGMKKLDHIHGLEIHGRNPMKMGYPGPRIGRNDGDRCIGSMVVGMVGDG